MAIRDTSYYGWQNIDIFRNNFNQQNFDCNYYDVYVDKNGIIYSTGFAATAAGLATYNWVTRASFDKGNTWITLDNFQSGTFSGGKAITIDISGGIYVAGITNDGGTGVAVWTVRKSNISSSTNWTTVDASGSTDGGQQPMDIIVDGNNNNVYVVGGQDSWYIRRSTDGGTTWTNVLVDGTSNSRCYGIALSGTTLYATGRRNNEWYTKRSVDGTTWTNVDIFQGHNGNASGWATSISVLPNGNIFTAGTYTTPISDLVVTVRSSSLGTTSSWGNCDLVTSCSTIGVSVLGDINIRDIAYIKNDSKNNVYVTVLSGVDSQLPSDIRSYVRHSPTGNCGSWRIVDALSACDATGQGNGSVLYPSNIFIDSNDFIYCTLNGQYPPPANASNTNNRGIIRRGKLSSNSASLGAYMFAPSFGYVKTDITGVLTEGFQINNVSEFPHSSGLFQMPNIVLGTKTQGRTGKTDDAIVQKKFIGSFVRMLFPKQDEPVEIKGADAARKPGKLSPEWQFGDVINIEGQNFDSISLNCYALKQVSGTMDAILVRVDTKPLNDIGFASEQIMETTTSGSFLAETIYRDELHRKDIDYGDLSLKEIGWKVPIDLKNVKEIRIAAKYKNGQTDDKNKQFLIVGRFIKSSKDTNEV